MKKVLYLFSILAVTILFSTTASAQDRFVAHLNGIQVVPANNSPGRGSCSIVLNTTETQMTLTCTYSNLVASVIAGHTHDNGPVGVNGPVRFGYGTITGTSGTIGPLNFPISAAQVADMRAKRHYANIHSSTFPGGEIRGQIKPTETVFDFDGDGRTDITVFRQNANSFFTRFNINTSLVINTHGSGAGDIWLNNTSDFDGDGRGDLLLLKLDPAPSNVLNWSILQTSNNTIRNERWGNFTTGNGETLAPADYDGDGRQDIAVYRRSTGTWYIKDSATGVARYEVFGGSSDSPVIGDYNKDGKADLTVVRGEGNQLAWYSRSSIPGTEIPKVFWGSNTDGFFFFAPIDIDGDGIQDRMTRRVVAGEFLYSILRSSDNGQTYILWGASTDTSLFGDYDGDGKTDFVSRRNVGGQLTWLILQSSNNYDRERQLSVPWGASGDQLVEDPELILDRVEPQPEQSELPGIDFKFPKLAVTESN